MTRFAQRILFAIIGIFFAGAAAAQSFECAAQGRGSQGNLIPPQWIITYSGNTAQIVHAWYGDAHSVTVEARGGQQRRMTYIIPQFQGFAGRNADLVFRITHNLGNGSLQVRVDPRGYDNRFTGSGTCRPA